MKQRVSRGISRTISQSRLNSCAEQVPKAQVTYQYTVFKNSKLLNFLAFRIFFSGLTCKINKACKKNYFSRFFEYLKA